MYNSDDAKALIDIARKAILDELPSEKILTDLMRKYDTKQGVFVTLKKDGKLRGCIGFVLPYFKLFDGVIRCAKAAAFEDPRFKSVTKAEVKLISIEISILTVPKKITIARNQITSKIKIGRDGLIIKRGYNQGLLLPQVFVEYNSTPEQALMMTCQKAGLPEDCWIEDETTIEIFQAQVFKEEQPRGKVVEEKLK